MSLQGSTALVTGSGQGIGREIALTLAKSGANIIVCDINKENANLVSEEIKSLNLESTAVSVDVADLSQIEKTIDNSIQEFGNIDILVNNAGITRDTFMLRMKKEDWKSVIDVNLTGVFNCTKTVAKYMMRQRRGKIVNITSIVGVMGNAGQVNYSASKAGVIGFTKSAARELASRNITVNAVAPGFIDTEMTRVLPDKTREKLLGQIPFNRFGLPQDVAKCVKFLVTEDANYITGQVIHVNGGMWM